MTYPNTTKLTAFSLFCQGVSLRKIAALFGNKPSARILTKWASAEDWVKKREEIYQATTEKNTSKVRDVAERQMQIIKAAQGKYIKQLEGKGFKITTGEITGMMKHEVVLAGGASERSDVNIGLDIPKLLKIARKELEEEGYDGK